MVALSQILAIAGAVVPPVWVALSDIASKYPDVRWLAGAVSVVSLLWSVLSAMGYAKQRTALKMAAMRGPVAMLLLAGSLLFASPAFAQDAPPPAPPATGPLAVQLDQPGNWSLHLNVTVPAFGYSLTTKQFIGQVTFGLNYVLDYKSLVALGGGFGYVQINDTPGMNVNALLGGPVLGKMGEQTSFRPAALYQYRWFGGAHEHIIAGTMALQF